MRPDPGLDELLTALRAARFIVGVDETLRLRRLFELSEEVDLARLGHIVAAVVVKSREDEERFREIFKAWKAGAETAFPEPEEAPEVSKDGPAQQARKPFPRALVAAGTAVAVVGIVLGVGWWRTPGPSIGTGGTAPTAFVDAGARDAGAGNAASSDAGVSDTGGGQAPSYATFKTPYPVITVEPHGLRSRRAGAAVAAFLTVLALSLGLRRRIRLPDPEPPVSPRQGPPDFVLGAPPLRGPVLLEESQRQALVWSVGRFTTEEPTHVLDVERTVETTARRGGVPALHFQHERRYRTVWLWIDESADDPALLRFADEMTTALFAAGLPVERATFWAIPDRLTAADGTVLGPLDLEEQGASSITAVLTDGRALGARFAASAQRTSLDALLRMLAEWPMVAFVDFSRGHTALPALLSGGTAFPCSIRRRRSRSSQAKPRPPAGPAPARRSTGMPACGLRRARCRRVPSARRTRMRYGRRWASRCLRGRSGCWNG